MAKKRRPNDCFGRVSSQLHCNKYPPFRGSSVFPETLESVRGKLGVTDRMLDVLVAQVVLQCASVMAVVGEFVAAGVPEHVGMHGEFDAGVLTGSFNELSHGVVRHWPATL